MNDVSIGEVVTVLVEHHGDQTTVREIPTPHQRKRRHAGWIRIHSEFTGGHRWWRVECLIPHEPNTVSRWWKARWDGPRGAVTSALEHLAAHAVRRVPLTPFEEVGAEEG